MSSEFMKFPSRRSTVYSTKGMVCSTQPLANAAGLEVLDLGGNCVDAAIAVSAALCITEPMSTGIGGDCFAIYYKDGKVQGLNGTGRAAKDLTIDYVREKLGDANAKRIPIDSVFAITVPGAIAGWADAHEMWGSGKVSFEQILAPAIRLAEEGFVVHEICANMWESCGDKLKKKNPKHEGKNPHLPGGKVPREGQIVKNAEVAATLTAIAKGGKDAFYKGEVAETIVSTVQALGHKMTLDDLANHTSTFVDPIKVEFRNHHLWEIPPNGSGLVAQIALGIVQELHKSGKINLDKIEHNSVEYLHALIEACKLGFHDSEEYVSDMEFHKIPVKELLSPAYLAKRAALIDTKKRLSKDDLCHGVPDYKHRSDTVYMTVADKDGNACSFINSVFYGFGSGILAGDKGFCLHNRGGNFNLNPGAINSLEGGKRPYHTILPALITEVSGDLFASFGNMGGFAQPVCQVQHCLNLLVFGMTPQQSIDSPRFVLEPDMSTEDRGKGSHGPIHTRDTHVALEEGISQEVIAGLEKLGHKTTNPKGYERGQLGRAQIIKKQTNPDGSFVFAGGSDLRGDGAAVAQV
ncbi:hypothetical protein DICA0_B09340 [Diutina catenulata]